MLKIKLNFYLTKDYENQGRLRPAGKQSQSKPVLSAVEWANFKGKKCAGFAIKNAKLCNSQYTGEPRPCGRGGVKSRQNKNAAYRTVRLKQ